MTKSAVTTDSSISDSSTPKTFLNKIADIVWPVHRHELGFFLKMTALYFCILLVQNLGRAMKDTIVTTLVGAETITFLKTGGVFPASILVTALYIKLLSLVRPRQIVYSTFGFFILFFLAFAFLLLPNYKELHLSAEATQNLVDAFPHLKWGILAIANWSFSLFYIIIELWPGIALSLLFWQFVNSITTMEQSKRFYILFGLLGQTGLYISGKLMQSIPLVSRWLINTYHLTVNNTQLFTQLLLVIMVVAILVGIGIFYLLNKKLQHSGEEVQFSAQKKHPSLLQSLKLVMHSRYIRLITILLICYGAAINLIEVPWKASASKLYPNPEDYLTFVGGYLSYNGILTVLLVIVGSNIIRRLGWLTGAMITPIVLFVTGMSFFAIINFSNCADLAYSMLGLEPLMIAVTIGTIQNVASKSTKYTLFDATKEMSYVPLESELRVKGKAAAEVVGTKLGKSLSSGAQFLLFSIIPAATSSAIVSMTLMTLFGAICAIWIWAVWQLNKEYTDLTAKIQ